MDLKRIANLILVAEQGSFSKAASIIGIAQPALGRQVKKLEEECGTPLLYRNGRGVSLTPSGEALLTRLRPLLNQIESAVSDLRDAQASPSGCVTLGLTPTVCHFLGVPLVQTLRSQYPGIKLNVITGYSGYIHEWLTDGRIDLAVMHDARRSPQIMVNPLAELDLFLVSSPNSLSPQAARKSEIALSELVHFHLVLPTKNHGLRRTVDLAMNQFNLGLNVEYEIDSLQLMKGIVEAGLAHTVLAKAAIQDEVLAGALVARKIVSPSIGTRLVSAFAVNKPLTQAVKTVEQSIKTILVQMTENARLSGTMKMLTADSL